MKNLLTLVFLFPLFLFSQSDSVTVEGKTYTGTVKKVYSDRFVFKTADDVEYMVMKNRLDALRVREQVVVKGQAAYQYVSDINYVFSGNLPDFKDQKFHLREAGAWGITASCLIVGGGITAGVGSALRNSRTIDGSQIMFIGSILGSVGTCFLIPTFISILKAGKVKSYRAL